MVRAIHRSVAISLRQLQRHAEAPTDGAGDPPQRAISLRQLQRHAEARA
jgi:hypothetical protein